jgi:hypothetical protein
VRRFVAPPEAFHAANGGVPHTPFIIILGAFDRLSPETGTHEPAGVPYLSCPNQPWLFPPLYSANTPQHLLKGQEFFPWKSGRITGIFISRESSMKTLQIQRTEKE